MAVESAGSEPLKVTVSIAAAESVLENSSVVSTDSVLSPDVNGTIARQFAKPLLVVASTPPTVTRVIVLTSLAVPVTRDALTLNVVEVFLT